VTPPFSTACFAMTIGNTICRFLTAPPRSGRFWESFGVISDMSQVSW
jgi:hypothetical protein